MNQPRVYQTKNKMENKLELNFHKTMTASFFLLYLFSIIHTIILKISYNNTLNNTNLFFFTYDQIYITGLVSQALIIIILMFLIISYVSKVMDNEN